MKASMEDLSVTRKKVNVVIPVEDVMSVRKEVFAEIKKEAKVKGFRPGKAPDDVINKMYKNEILSEVATRLVHNTLESALSEVSAAPISRPDITPTDEFTTDKDFEYTAEFDVLPPVELKEYKGLPLKKEVREVSDEDVEEALKNLQEHRAETTSYEDEDKKVEKGDVVTVDFTGFLDGKPIKDLHREDVQFAVGEEKMIQEFETNVLNMKRGEEKEFTVDYDKDFQIEEAAGKTVNFKLKVKDILEKKVPAINDELAQAIGLESVKELRDKIKEDLKLQIDQQAQTRLKNEMLDMLVDKNDVEAPDSLVQEEASRMVQQVAQNMEQRGMKAPPMDENTQKMVQERADRNVRASIILGEIAKLEEIKVTDNDINDNLKSVAEAYNMPVEQVRDVYEQNNMLDGLSANLAEQKVIDFVLENAKIEEVPADHNHVDNK